MENLINRLEIVFYNLSSTNKIEKKEEMLNKAMNMIKFCRSLTDFNNYLYVLDPNTYEKMLSLYDKPSLILLTYDLLKIGQAINLPDNSYISHDNNYFYINTNPVSPFSDTNSEEWN